MSGINKRINELAVEFFNGNNSKFAKAIGVSEANIRNYRAETEPKIDTINKISELLEINYEWIMLGKGEMVRNTGEINTSNIEVRGHSNTFTDINSRNKNSKNISNNPELLEKEIIHLKTIIREKEKQLEDRDKQIKFLQEMLKK